MLKRELAHALNVAGLRELNHAPHNPAVLVQSRLLRILRREKSLGRVSDALADLVLLELSLQVCQSSARALPVRRLETLTDTPALNHAVAMNGTVALFESAPLAAMRTGFQVKAILLEHQTQRVLSA
ncbi:MAG: hypothetical protein ACK527_16195 [Acidobacteriota bacterium]